jgi:predicted dienelactone hydrolase
MGVCLATGCGGAGARDGGEPDAVVMNDSGAAGDAAARGDVTMASDADASAVGADAAAACAADNRAACVYRPARTFGAQAVLTQTLAYTDATGAQRSIEVAIRRPMGAPQPWPVVLWSHGGASGQMSANGAGDEWSRVFNAAGYLFVAIAHAPRSDESRAALCAHLGITVAADCARFKYLHWDRPYDVRRTLDWMEEQARGMFAGAVDLQRLLYAGHSAGAGATSMVAGASREMGGVARVAPDPRPRAFIGFSIEGPGDDGFTDASFAAITRPHMSVTGAGDRTTETEPLPRRLPFELMAPGNKYRFWNTDEASLHGTFDHNVGPCEGYQMRNGAPVARCAEFYAWMESAALAFADAHLRERPEAIAWLASDNMTILSSGAVEWRRR